jgi:hypothetical protein
LLEAPKVIAILGEGKKEPEAGHSSSDECTWSNQAKGVYVSITLTSDEAAKKVRGATGAASFFANSKAQLASQPSFVVLDGVGEGAFSWRMDEMHFVSILQAGQVLKLSVVGLNDADLKALSLAIADQLRSQPSP